jgi:NADP-dependent 3-hydroxy acid dehydrogenase YdfG
MKFKDKIVLVVGASSGMGRGVAVEVAREGAQVVATARRQKQLDALVAEITQGGGVCLALAADAKDEAAAAAVVANTIDRFGRIDLALLNVGGAPSLDMRTMSAAEVNGYMRSNYDVIVNYLVPVLRQMAKQGFGLVAHTNSLAGLLGVPLQGPYSAAKGAARLLIDTCRIEFSSYGVKFVSIYPGFVATARTANHGMPAPLEISESQAVAHILYALRRERSDYLFPFSMRWLIRLALILPKSATNWILARQMPTMPTVPGLTSRISGSVRQ